MKDGRGLAWYEECRERVAVAREHVAEWGEGIAILREVSQNGGRVAEWLGGRFVW